jgi:aldehyde:ferredoxin oxidoreductase
MGKILRIDLTKGKISSLETARYEEWGGGHGIGSAIFWDLCKDKAISGFDPRNVVTIMSSPLSGTLAPAVAGRTEVQGIGVQGYPIDWYTRSNFGGRFSGMLKYAGWDGIVIEGKAEKPVWIDVRDDDVQIRDAKGLWGLDTWATQEEIWREVSSGMAGRDWWQTGTGRDKGRTTQRPAVLTMGPVGEHLSRVAALVHDAGNGAGQGGFGAVWGSKNLKAVSVIGTGSVEVADPKALLAARVWIKKTYEVNVEDPYTDAGAFAFGGKPGYAAYYPPGMASRPQGCLGCHKNCRGRTEVGRGNESSCVDYLFYNAQDAAKHGGKITEAVLNAADLMQRAGINSYELEAGIIWLNALYKKGILGAGRRIQSTLPFDQLGETEFIQKLISQIEERKEIGKDLADGLARAAKKWGRLDEDLRSGILPLQYWGYPQHYDARTEVEWGYGSILGERDINEHDFNFAVYWTPTIASLTGQPNIVSAQVLAQIIAEKCKPYSDPLMVDYSDEGIYSEHMAKLVAWHRHYTRFWKQAIGYCDWAWADFVNPNTPDKKGITGEGEPKFFNAVTGKNITFEDGIEIGRKIWNLDRAIWALQGRHRDLEKFAEYTYQSPAKPGYTSYELPYTMPVNENGEWKYKSVAGRVLDKAKFEEWKTKYYTLEGWDPATGWPKRKTLEGLGLKHVADELQQHGKLGG